MGQTSPQHVHPVDSTGVEHANPVGIPRHMQPTSSSLTRQNFTPTYTAHDPSFRPPTAPSVNHLPPPALSFSQAPASSFSIEQQTRAQMASLPTTATSTSALARPPAQLSGKNYTSILLRHRTIVDFWSQQFEYSEREASFVVQYFIQLTQVFPSCSQEILTDILGKRSIDIAQGRRWHLLHEHDPLKMFADIFSPDGQLMRRQGVPHEGFVLGNIRYPAVGPGQYSKGQQGFQLAGYAPSSQPLPIGTTLVQIIHHYPNHMAYEFLDSFLMHGVTGGNIFEVMPTSVRKAFVDNGLMTQKSASNVFLKRMKARRLVLVQELGFDTAGLGELQRYLSCPVKIFDLGRTERGPTLLPNRCKFQNVQDLREELRKTASQQPGQNSIQGLSNSTTSGVHQAPISSQPVAGFPSAFSQGVHHQAPQAQQKMLAYTADEFTKIFDPQVLAAADLMTSATTTPSIQPQDIQTDSKAPGNGSTGHKYTSISLADTEGLGIYRGVEFWTDEAEKQDFVRSIAGLRSKQAKYLDWILQHSPAFAATDGSASMPLQMAVVLRLIDEMSLDMYGKNCRDANTRVSIDTAEKAILRQLESDVKYQASLSAENPVASQNNSREMFDLVKYNAMEAMKSLEHLFAQFLACKLACILRGDRTPLINDTLLSRQLRHAWELCQDTDRAIIAQKNEMTPAMQLFFFHDQLTNAIMDAIAQRVTRRVAARFPGREWAQQVRQETTLQYQALAIPGIPATQPLELSLRQSGMGCLVTIASNAEGLEKGLDRYFPDSSSGRKRALEDTDLEDQKRSAIKRPRTNPPKMQKKQDSARQTSSQKTTRPTKRPRKQVRPTPLLQSAPGPSDERGEGRKSSSCETASSERDQTQTELASLLNLASYPAPATQDGVVTMLAPANNGISPGPVVYPLTLDELVGGHNTDVFGFEWDEPAFMEQFSYNEGRLTISDKAYDPEIDGSTFIGEAEGIMDFTQFGTDDGGNDAATYKLSATAENPSQTDNARSGERFSEEEIGLLLQAFKNDEIYLPE
jgi:hypothetical protein